MTKNFKLKNLIKRIAEFRAVNKLHRHKIWRSNCIIRFGANCKPLIAK